MSELCLVSWRRSAQVPAPTPTSESSASMPKARSSNPCPNMTPKPMTPSPSSGSQAHPSKIQGLPQPNHLLNLCSSRTTSRTQRPTTSPCWQRTSLTSSSASTASTRPWSYARSKTSWNAWASAMPSNMSLCIQAQPSNKRPSRMSFLWILSKVESWPKWFWSSKSKPLLGQRSQIWGQLKSLNTRHRPMSMRLRTHFKCFLISDRKVLWHKKWDENLK